MGYGLKLKFPHSRQQTTECTDEIHDIYVRGEQAQLQVELVGKIN